MKKNRLLRSGRIISILMCMTIMLTMFNIPTYAYVGDPELPANPIGEELYEEALSYGFKGQIWITKDGNFGVGDASINHGHAGILYAYAPYYRAFIEHRGYKTGPDYDGNQVGDGLSYMYVWDWGEGDTWWSTVHTLRTYNVHKPGATTAEDVNTMVAAADYAQANLIGLSYAPLSLKTNVTNVNCATLVYKAYLHGNWMNSGGYSIGLGNPSSPTVIPKDLVEDTNLVPVFNAQWGGNQHTGMGD